MESGGSAQEQERPYQASGASLRVEFESCIQGKGPTSDVRYIDVDDNGKPPRKQEAFEVFNTRFDSQITF
jgi:hypothetical protein